MLTLTKESKELKEFVKCIYIILRRLSQRNILESYLS